MKPSREITDAERALLHRFADVLDEGSYCPDPSPFHGDLVRRAAEEIERLREEIERLCSGDGLEYVMVCRANEQRDQALAHVERADNEAAKAKKLATSEAELRFKAEERIVELEAKCEMLSDDSVLMQEYEKKCARVAQLEAALLKAKTYVDECFKHEHYSDGVTILLGQLLGAQQTIDAALVGSST